MSLRLYDTSTRSVREFVPLAEGKVTIYLCGATVQAPPHIGHIRSGVDFDVLYRWLAHRGYDVTLCRNVTDIDDKIISRAAVEGVPWWQVAQRNERAFADAYRLLGCLPPTVEPRATGHIPEMLALIGRLIERGHAYPSDGDVYFDVRSYPDYGALSGQRPGNMLVTEEAEAGRPKRDPLDFALWKAAKPGEPSWDTPWGTGRPGWHLECSAMARKYLGPRFDIHGGGIDLIFPHHENEIAQSRSAGDEFAGYWLHHAWVTTSGEKMSKSLGNSLLVSEVVKRVRPVALRYFLVAPHYRSTVEYSEDAIEEAVAAYGRIEGFVQRAGELVGETAPAAMPPSFARAMDDDLGVPQALAAVHTAVREGNTALSAGDKDAVARGLGELRAMLDVLGLDPLAEQWAGDRGQGDLPAVVDALVAALLEQREAARERKDYAAADAIRDRLAAAGLVVEDTPRGPRWTRG
ncbi:MAG: cysteine--tRNA ligase [Carbonactinosporaceae bacterium]